ncbi:hypothetical protein HDU84_007560, partial [Entophlyctis sp. JEL0112]
NWPARRLSLPPRLEASSSAARAMAANNASAVRLRPVDVDADADADAYAVLNVAVDVGGLPLYALPLELLAQVMRHVLRPAAARLSTRVCVLCGVSRRFNSAVWLALVAESNLSLHSLHQRAFIAAHAGLPARLPPRLRNLLFGLRSLDLGFRPIDMAPPNTPFAATPASLAIIAPTSTSFAMTTLTSSSLSRRPPANTPRPSYSSISSSVSSVSSAGSSVFANASSTAASHAAYGSQWFHRFIADDLIKILSLCPNLRSLCIAGCQIRGEDIEVVASSFRNLFFGLQSLDVSMSNLKGSALVALVDACSGTLEILDISGIFKLRRNSASVLYSIVDACPNLKRLIANDCPDIDLDVRVEVCLRNPQMKFLGDFYLSQSMASTSASESDTVSLTQSLQTLETIAVID